MTDLIQIRPAHVGEAPYLARLLALAFQADPVSCWLIPDPDERWRRQPDFFRVFVDEAFTGGEVHTTDDRQAVALWFSINPGIGEETNQTTEQRLRDVLGIYHTAFTVVTRLMASVHPAAIHHAYLPFIGVHPTLWGQGVGGRLMQYKLAALDATTTPSYLEASSTRSRDLYQRLGYRQLPQVIPLPNGPVMYPMWRAARRANPNHVIGCATATGGHQTNATGRGPLLSAAHADPAAVRPPGVIRAGLGPAINDPVLSAPGVPFTARQRA